MLLTTVAPLMGLIIGVAFGYYYGLSLVQQEKAPSFSFLPFIRLFLVTLFGITLLHWGIIPFILFIVGLIFTMWIVIFNHTR